MRKLLLVASIFAAALPAQTTAGCDRACLEGFVNRYLAALAAHQPADLPLASSSRFSENDEILKPGEGVWKTVTGIGNYKLYMADARTGQAAYFGTLKEGAEMAAFALRLEIANHRIEEIETLVVRGGGAGTAVEQMGKPDPAFLETAPGAGRISRQALIAAANAYWNSVVRGSAARTPFDRRCNRIQNGIRTTNNPELNITPDWSWNPLSLGCEDQLNTKFFTFIQAAEPRRWLLVDEERQLVFGFVMAQAPGTVTAIDAPGHGRNELPSSVKGRYDIDVAELYQLRDGKIRQVEAIQTRLPYGTKSPFAPAR